MSKSFIDICNTYIKMDYNHIIIQFCERKLFPDQPEYLNCFSALYISWVGLYNIIYLKNLSKCLEIIYWCMVINGIMSFFLHYTGWYLFKLLDEFSMIIPLWIGLCKFLQDLEYKTLYIGLITLLNISLLGLNVFSWFSNLFPIIFASEMLIIIPLYYQLINLNKTNIIIRKHNWITNKGIKGIIICCISGVIWFITELNCNIYFILGHSIWHIGMSTGMCYIIIFFNERTQQLNYKL